MQKIIQETLPGIFVELVPFAAIRHGDVVQPWQAVDLWSDGDLATIDVYRLEFPATPEGKMLGGYSFARVDGTPSIIPVWDDVPPLPPIMEVTPRQFRLALNATGMRASIEAYVAAGSQDMKDTWEFATTIERNNALIAAGAAELGLTEAQINDLFTLAVTL